HLLLDRDADEVLDELRVIGAVEVDAGDAIATRVAEVGARADVATCDGRCRIEIACASAAPKTLRPPVPGALHATVAAISEAERQRYDDVDVLSRIRAVEDAHFAVRRRCPSRGYHRAYRRLHVGRACDAVRRIGCQRGAVGSGNYTRCHATEPN